MKHLKLFGIPVASFGESKPASRGKPVAPPFQQGATLSPRFEPSNITQDITANDIQNAIREAENGQTYNLFRLYRDVLLSDNHIQAEINTRKLALLAQPLAIMPADKDNPDDVALAAAFTRAKSDCANWRDGLVALMDSNCGWPVSIVEKIMQPAGEPAGDEPQLQFTLARLVPVNPQALCYQWAYQLGGFGSGTASSIQQIQTPANGLNQAPYIMDLNRWEPYLKLWPIGENGRIIYDATHAEYLDRTRHMVHRGHLLTGFRDNWGGPFRAILFWWYFRNLGREWFARFMERFGSPFPVGYTDATDAAAVALLREAFDLARSIGGLVVDESSRIDLKEAMVAGGADGHKTFHDLCNNEISKLITGLDSGSKPHGLNAGANQMQQSVREDYRMFDQSSLSETVIQQLVIPFRDMNGLKGMIKLVWGGLSDVDAKMFADFLMAMSTAGWTPTDDAIPTVEERTGIPFERIIPPAPLDPGFGGTSSTSPQNKNSKKPTPFTVFSVGDPQPKPTPIDSIVEKHSAALAAAFRGALAPVRQIVLSSTSRADCEAKLKLFYADWQPQRVQEILEEALQVCAATGAAEGSPKPKV